jgi:hypothetical protein
MIWSSVSPTATNATRNKPSARRRQPAAVVRQPRAQPSRSAPGVSKSSASNSSRMPWAKSRRAAGAVPAARFMTQRAREVVIAISRLLASKAW